MRKTKIICTLGPAVDSESMIELLIQNGMDCARLNFSHGDHEEQKRRVEMVRRVGDRLGRHIAILLDTKGPEIRLGNFKNHRATLERGNLFILTSDEVEKLEADLISRAYEKYRTTTGVAAALGISQPTAFRKIEKYIKS